MLRKLKFYYCRTVSRTSWCIAWLIYNITKRRPMWYHFSLSQYRGGGPAEIYWCGWYPDAARDCGWDTEVNNVVLPHHHKIV